MCGYSLHWLIGVCLAIFVCEREQMLHLALGSFSEIVIVLLSLVSVEGEVKTVSAQVGVVTDRSAFYFT